jgi:hypothetical protein
MEAKRVFGNDTLHKKIIQWGCNALSSLGYTLKNNLPKTVVDTPWSCVLRFATSDGSVYLKHTPALLALEANIIHILRAQFHASVPVVIAQNAELDCFLMQDAGRPLREVLKQKFDVALLCKAIDQFTALQFAVADQVEVFLEIGVPDWRLNKLPDLYKEVISQKGLLIADGLSERESDVLEALIPKVSHACQKLSDYSIPQTLVQPDFSDNNILIEDVSHQITLIDLGEISISHPFFSLLNSLQQVKKHHALREDEDRYLRIKEACLKNYMHLMPEQEVLDAFAMAQRVWLVYGILAQYRLMAACGAEKIIAFQHGRLSGVLKALVAVCREP